MSSLDLADRPPAGEVIVTQRAMATRVTINVPASSRISGSPDGLEASIASAQEVFHQIDSDCTRFEQSSPLMLANRSPQQWHQVPHSLFWAIEEAKRAYDATNGLFDPRVLRRLVELGYDRTLRFDLGDVRVDQVTRATGPPQLGPWRPRFRNGSGEVLIGEDPIDLGGIGKGLAVRWSSQILKRTASDFLVEAGGDCYCAGFSEDGRPWQIGVEDPGGNDEPICVLSVHDRAITTSSIRLRRWALHGQRVHHLIDPITGEPGGSGLVAVTVVGEDPARSEVWSKALFISGHAAIATLAEQQSIPALWIDDHGTLANSSTMQKYVQWRRS